MSDKADTTEREDSPWYEVADYILLHPDDPPEYREEAYFFFDEMRGLYALLRPSDTLPADCDEELLGDEVEKFILGAAPVARRNHALACAYIVLTRLIGAGIYFFRTPLDPRHYFLCRVYAAIRERLRRRGKEYFAWLDSGPLRDTVLPYDTAYASIPTRGGIVRFEYALKDRSVRISVDWNMSPGCPAATPSIFDPFLDRLASK